MNSKQTGWLVVLAVGLFAYIYFVEWRRAPVVNEGARRVLPGISVTKADRVEVTLDGLVLRAERTTNELWALTKPLAYPARQGRVLGLLEMLGNLQSSVTIPARELAKQPRGLADYGLQHPQATIQVEQAGQKYVLRVGNRTAMGNRLYVQVDDDSEVQVVGDALLKLLPAAADDWRDNALLSLRGINFSRLEIRTGGRVFEVQRDSTNKLWRITKPMVTRADNPKLENLLQLLQIWPVRQFVSDDPQVDLDRYGLRPPEVELVFGEGTNELLNVQFGRPATNDSAFVYARRLSNTNIVTVPREWLEPLRSPFAEFRDRRLFDVAPAAISSAEIRADETFTLSRQTNGTWWIGGATNQLADPVLVTNFLQQIPALEVVEFVKDVVTDFSAYGLTPPAQQYSFWTTVTNAGASTNQLLAQLDIGRSELTKAYVRRAGEDSVYAMALGDMQRLPTRRYELRDRNIWSFTTNQVSRIGIQQFGQSRELIRNAKGEWTIAPGSQGVINPPAVEEAVFRLGHLRAERWVAQGADRLAAFGITELSQRIGLEVTDGDKTRTMVLRLSTHKSPHKLPYAAALVDGQPVVFEIPEDIYPALLTYLSLPPVAGQN